MDYPIHDSWMKSRSSSTQSSDEDTTDEGPLLPYKYSHPRCRPDGRDKRPLTVLAKICLFSAAMMSFCIVLYIPIYNRANEEVPTSMVAGWSYNTNRDTKVYVQPSVVTTIHDPKFICDSKNKLYLLIVVCSATKNFEKRNVIRQSWGNYSIYEKSSKLFNLVKDRYKDYNFTYDLYKVNASRKVRDIGFGQLLPKLAEALKDNLKGMKNGSEDFDNGVISEFDMNKQFDTNTIQNYDYDYDTNVMRIPQRGDEESQDLNDILKMLKKAQTFDKKEKIEKSGDNGKTGDSEKPGFSTKNHPKVDFKVVFLMGLPYENDTDTQNKIDEEAFKYGDVIQENFIDTYNNLTLKSIMMLKWATHQCNESVRYLLKTDDDMFINVPSLMRTLNNLTREHETRVSRGYTGDEHLLMGDLICGAKPVTKTNHKWYTPRYMFAGRHFPKYLSGTAYALSFATARSLYHAALYTPLLHLEDVFITGVCPLHSSPRITPRDAAGFSYRSYGKNIDSCDVHSHVTLHGVRSDDGVELARGLLTEEAVDRCERKYLTEARQAYKKLKKPQKNIQNFLKLISDGCNR